MTTSLSHAWIFAAPLFGIGLSVALRHRAAAHRMADMTGYSRKEKVVAVSASSLPHLFALLTIFIPLSQSTAAVITGALLYAVGLAGFIAAVAAYVRTPPSELAVRGIYRISRNPMYVAALLAYAGITVLTLNVLLAMLLTIMIALHHPMILSEERACAERFGREYERYAKSVPRYL